MKLTKSKLKQLINEELEDMQQEGLLDMFSKKKPKITYSPTRADYTDEEWRAVTTSGDLPDPTDQEALDASYEIIDAFLSQTQDKSNVERHVSLRKLMRDLSSLVIYKTPQSKLRQEHNDE